MDGLARNYAQPCRITTAFVTRNHVPLFVEALPVCAIPRRKRLRLTKAGFPLAFAVYDGSVRQLQAESFAIFACEAQPGEMMVPKHIRPINSGPRLKSGGPDFGRKLLDHNGLMTPVLRRFFGDVTAEQSRFDEDRQFYRRVSTIRQHPHGIMILEASLTLCKQNLPASLINALRETNMLFGQLLLDHDIETHIQARQVFRQNPDAGQAPRWGRKLEIVDKLDARLLCKVNEYLAPDDLLVKHCIIPRDSTIV